MENELNMYSYLKFVHHGSRLEKLRNGEQPYPVSLRFVLSDFCNHNCSFCIFRLEGDDSNKLFGVVNKKTGVRNNNPNRMIPTSKALEIIDDCKAMGVKSIEFTGGGEPTAQPDHVEIFQKVVDSDIEYALITNGSIFKPGLVDVLMHATWCRFSLDAGAAKTYSYVREVPQKVFKKVQNNIKTLSKARDKNKSNLTIGTSFIITDNNYSELYEAAKIASGLGVDNFRIGYYRTDEGFIEPAYHDNLIETIERCKQDFERPGFDIIDRYDSTSANIAEGRPNYKFCGYQHFSTWIAGDLNVYRCCVTSYNEHGLVGSIKNQSFKELWDSEQKKKALENFNAKSCKRCIYNDKNKGINYFLNNRPPHINFV